MVSHFITRENSFYQWLQSIVIEKTQFNTPNPWGHRQPQERNVRALEKKISLQGILILGPRRTLIKGMRTNLDMDTVMATIITVGHQDTVKGEAHGFLRISKNYSTF